MIIVSSFQTKFLPRPPPSPHGLGGIPPSDQTFLFVFSLWSLVSSWSAAADKYRPTGISVRYNISLSLASLSSQLPSHLSTTLQLVRKLFLISITRPGWLADLVGKTILTALRTDH